jgi:hypothetical protein
MGEASKQVLFKMIDFVIDLPPSTIYLGVSLLLERREQKR